VIKRLENLRSIFNQLSIKPEKVLIAGSTSLGVFGILDADEVSDFDILVGDKSIWESLKKTGKIDKRDDGERITYKDKISGESLEFFLEWPLTGKPEDKLFEKSMDINGLKIMSLDHVVRYKLKVNREKDRKHLRAVKAWLHSSKMEEKPYLKKALKKRAYRDVARALAMDL
jgi:hypothetical protein